MSIKLQVGIFYTLHNGEKVGPMEWEPRGWFYVKGKRGRWLENGRPEDDYTAEKFGPIISAWSEGPVRTVTRREVAPGVYGRVAVETDVSGFVSICLTEPRGGSYKESHARSFTASDLRSAAMIFSQIAEAMDDGESK